MTAVDRKTFELIDMEVVDFRTKNTIHNFIDRLRSSNNIEHYHTDKFKQYKSYFDMNNNLSISYTKNQTTRVESFNSILRQFISPLKRKSKSINHSNSRLYKVIYTFGVIYNKKIKSFMDFIHFFTTFVKQLGFKRVDSIKLPI